MTYRFKKPPPPIRETPRRRDRRVDPKPIGRGPVPTFTVEITDADAITILGALEARYQNLDENDVDDQDEMQNVDGAMRQVQRAHNAWQSTARAGHTMRMPMGGPRRRGGPTTLTINADLSAIRRGTGFSKAMRGAPTEYWVVHPHDEPGASVLGVDLFRSPGQPWAAWTANFTRAQQRELAQAVAAARNAEGD